MATTSSRVVHRYYKREFKFAVVRSIANGDRSPAQISREHNLDAKLLSRWRKEYERLGEEAFQPKWERARCVPTQAHAGTPSLSVIEQGCGEKDTHDEQIAQLERFCGKLALENYRLQQQLQTQSSNQARGERAKTTR